MLTPDKFASTPVYDLLQAAGQGKVGVDRRWLHAILDPGQEAVPDLVRYGMEDHDEDPVVLDDVLIDIFEQLKSPAAVPFFVKYLRDNTDVPDNFADALAPVREAAVGPLIELYGELEEDESAEVAFTLAALRVQDERVLKILLDRLEYDVTDGAICLGLYGDPAARPALEAALEEVSEDDHLKRTVEDAIDDLGRPVTDDAPAAFNIFDAYPEKSAPETSVLVESELLDMLEGSDIDYRLAAAAAFINRELSDASRAKLLEHANSDAERSVRAKCWEALGADIEEEGSEIFRTMVARLEDESAPKVERAGVLVGLGQFADKPPIRKYAEEFYEDPETRAAALAAMWNSLDREFGKYFPPHLDDPDPEIRKQAISGVGYLGIHSSAEKLRDFFDDDDFRPNALFAYALAVRSEISPGRVRALLRRIEDMAKGFTEEEEELVQVALDERLMLHGHKPAFNADPHRHSEEEEPGAAQASKVGRNDPCPCGSGKKYKKCCGA